MPSSSHKFVGNINRSDPANGYQVVIPDDFASMWDQISCENCSKWDALEPQRDQMNWTQIDKIHDYAVANGLLFKWHTAIWGSQEPAWVRNFGTDAASNSELKAEVIELFEAFCDRYPDVAMIDVVNEPPPHTTPSTIAALGGAGASGWDWVAEAFRLARAACPNAVLIFNDYNNIEYDTENDQRNFIKIAQAVQNAGAPIDALGAQAHDAYKLDKNVLQARIDKLASLGLPLYITEYDIDEPDDEKQRAIMAEQFPLFWNDPRIAGITLWGYIYGATWRTDTGLQKNGQNRPALTWLLDYLRQQGAR